VPWSRLGVAMPGCVVRLSAVAVETGSRARPGRLAAFDGPGIHSRSAVPQLTAGPSRWLLDMVTPSRDPGTRRHANATPRLE